MKILLDMNISPRWKEFLEGAGEIEHWSEIGRANDPDAEILKHAAEHGHVVLTLDVDFGTMLAERRLVFPSVIQIRCKEVLPALVSARICAIFTRYRDELLAGTFVSIDERTVRIRRLPLR